MSARHTPETRRIQGRFERWELDHLRELAAAQAAEIERQAERIDELQRQVDYMDDVAEWQHRETMALGERMEEAGTGHLGLTMSGTLCVIVGSPPQMGLSS